ncbi:hypothetical protein Patl1_10630 [Pistacia atlantica]|uniref:Uncharacterized protein n=1 Tax=Pistacia atlantica TaxID=434234 RepID=A0ACC1A1E0_9ROSI|nr:hypothetical protein Patl1_10630 [Pistacia atlantica]
MVGLIDLNTTEDEDTPSSASLSPSPSSSSASALSASTLSASGVSLELWHACAGPLISLPKRGSVVVYFPQGHFEHVSDYSAASSAPFDLPPHVFCRVADVKLHAEAASDEVYAQVSLVPETEQTEKKLLEGKIEGHGEEDVEVAAKSSTPHMFCKTLTASDTSTHGGFSVPRRAAEDCFPPLDYSQQRPSQELVAKDLHGLEWRFRHIYRGQPRRHLLTTGWSAFVNKKKLVSGDAVLFLRGEDGELRLGIRRASQVKSGAAFPSSCSQQGSASEFIIPVHKFLKSLDHHFSVGMRFKMRFETEDSAERRFGMFWLARSSINLAILNSYVRWDDSEANGHTRVSPWEIEQSGSAANSNSLITPGLKRTRMGLPSGKPDFPVPGRWNWSTRLWGIFEVPEGLARRCRPGSNGPGIAATGDGISNLHVLQGQEIIPQSPYGRAPTVNEAHGNGCVGIRNGGQMLGSRNGWSSAIQGYSTHMSPPAPSVQVSSPSSVLMFQLVNNPVPNYNPPLHSLNDQKGPRIGNHSVFHSSETYGQKQTSSSPYEHSFRGDDPGGLNSLGQSNEHIQLGISRPLAPQSACRGGQDIVSSCKSSCRLFGFCLTEERHVATVEDNTAPATSQLNPRASLLPHVGEHFHPKPPMMTKAVGNNCTNVSNLYACTRSCFLILRSVLQL